MLELALLVAVVVSAPNSPEEPALPPSAPPAVAAPAPEAQVLPPPLDAPVEARAPLRSGPRTSPRPRLLSQLELEELRLQREQLLEEMPGLGRPIAFLAVSLGVGVLAGLSGPMAFQNYGSVNILGVLLFAGLALTHLIFGTVGAVSLSQRIAARAEVDEKVARLDDVLSGARTLPAVPPPAQDGPQAAPAGL